MVKGPYGPEPDPITEESAGSDKNGEVMLTAAGKVLDEGESKVEDNEVEDEASDEDRTIQLFRRRQRRAKEKPM